MSKECVFEGEWIMMELRTPCNIAAPNFAKWARLWNSARDEFLTRHALMNRSAGAVSFRGFIKLYTARGAVRCARRAKRENVLGEASLFWLLEPRTRPESDAAAHFGRSAQEKRGKNTFCAAFLFPLLYCSPGISQETKHFFTGRQQRRIPPRAPKTQSESCINLHRNGIKTHARLSLLHLKSE